MELIKHKINGVEIDEPIGFDNFKTSIKRGENHGISAEVSTLQLTFYGEAAETIRQAYATDVDIELVYTIEQKCGNGDWAEVYRGVIDLATYNEMTGDYCTVSCYVGEVGAKTTFNNRSQTTVSLDRETTLDGEAVKSLANLKRGIALPSKAIINSNRSEESYGEDINISKHISETTTVNWWFVLPLGEINLSEISDFYPSKSLINLGERATYYFSGGYPDGLSTVTKVDDNMACFILREQMGFNDPHLFHVDIRTVFDLYNTSSSTNSFNYRVQIIHANSDGSIKNVLKDMYLLDAPWTTHIDMSYSGDVSMGYGEKISVLLRVYHTAAAYQWDFHLKYNTIESFCRIQALSVTPPSVHTISLVFDALSRISDIISGLPVKSDWYNTNGGGWLKSIVNGWELRKAELPVGKTPDIQLSFRDLFTSLTAIDNVGWGFWEENGQLYVRVERWHWFYKNHVVFSIDNPNKKTRKADTKRIFSRLKVGYSKSLDQQEINAIDTFHTEREFSTGLKAVDTVKEAVCKFIADPYAIEVTRRKQFEKTTENWKYDEDVFVIALKAEISDVFAIRMLPNAAIVMPEHLPFLEDNDVLTSSTGGQYTIISIDRTTGYIVTSPIFPPAGGQVIGFTAQNSRRPDKFAVDTGVNDSSNTIISPETLYNARISPKRNAIRWAERFFEVNSLQEELRFVSGTGNVEAKGRVLANYGNYVFLEDSAENIPVTENEYIPKKQPVLKPEILEFTYPLTAVEYNLIKNDPYGIIQVDGEDCYLSELEYDFSTGEAHFKLVPSAEF